MELDTLRGVWAPRILSILRIMTALLLLQYGMAKMIGFPAHEYLNNVPRFSLPWFAGVLEFTGGALMLIGLFTRPAAFVLSGLMACAYFIGHVPKGFFPLLNGGNLAVQLCFTFLYFACAGGGAWSLDALLWRGSRERMGSGAAQAHRAA
jgi:putative oxidoreductase